jgi:hypothetical protein
VEGVRRRAARESRLTSAAEDESTGTRGGVGGASAVEEELTVFASSIQELHISIIIDRSCIFRSPFASSVGGNFFDAQCRKTLILSLDLHLRPPLEIA